MNSIKKRIVYIDILKLFAIFLVIWGHAVMHFQPDFHDSYIFRTIYAFHMPLFMMLSGYFAVSSMELSPKDFFPKKFRQLLLPCLSWGIVCWLVITSGLIEGRFHLDLLGLFTGWLGVVDNFWFLKSCFICYVLAWLCWRGGRYKGMALAIACILCSLQGRFFLSTMFPAFLTGIFLRRNTNAESWLYEHRSLPVILFLLLLTLKLTIINEHVYVFKLLLGLSGAISFLLLFRKMFNGVPSSSLTDELARLGGGTLGIYILQAILLEFVLPRYLSLSENSMPVIIAIMPLLSISALIICSAIVLFINRSNIFGFLMFGREYKQS